MHAAGHAHRFRHAPTPSSQHPHARAPHPFWFPGHPRFPVLQPGAIMGAQFALMWCSCTHNPFPPSAEARRSRGMGFFNGV